METAETASENGTAPAADPLVPTPPTVSKKTLATWKKQLKNLKTKDASKKIDGLRYCAQDERFVREQPEVLPVLIEMLTRVKTPDVIAETLRTFQTLLTQTETPAFRPTTAETPPANGVDTAPSAVTLHPEQNRQFLIDASSADAKNAWRAGEPFIALWGASVSPEIKIQAIHVFGVLLDHCSQTGQSDRRIELQTTGTPATTLLTCLVEEHPALQLAAIEALAALFREPPGVEFLTAFHAADGLTKLQPFVERPECRCHSAMLQIAERFSHDALGREYLRASNMAESIRILLAATLETTTSTIAAANTAPTAAIPLTLDDATRMHENVAIASRTYARMLFAREVPTLTAFTDAYTTVPAVVETLVAILQRDIASVVPPPPPPAAPSGNNAAAQAAAAAAATTAATLASLFPFSSSKCVDMLTSLGRMVEASDLVQRHAKRAGILPVLLQAFRVPDDGVLHQSADKLLHLCAPVATAPSESPHAVDPQLFGAIQASDPETGSTVDQPPLLAMDSLLPVFESASTDETMNAVVFRVVRWLSVVVEAPENARALGDTTMNLVVKVFTETKPSETLMCGFLTKCIQAIASQSPEACELCSTEARNPVSAIVAFLHTAYRPTDAIANHRAVSQLEPLPSHDNLMDQCLTVSPDLPLEWPSEFDALEILEPQSLTAQCHTFDPFLCGAKTLEVFASAYARFRATTSDTPAVDFAELLSQRADAAGKTAANAAVKKKPTGDITSKPTSTGEAIVLCVLEKVVDIGVLLGLYSSHNGDVAVSLLTTMRALVELPGGVRAMLTLARTALDAAPVETSPAVEGEGEGEVAPPPVVVPPPHPSAWPWTRDEARQTEFGWLLSPILRVFETSVTCFYQLEAAVAVLTAIVNDGSDVAPAQPLPTSGVVSSVEISISSTDRFINTALSQGVLVYLLAILDTERVPKCPTDSDRRDHLALAVAPLALTLIERGAKKQADAVAKRQELLDLNDQQAAAAADAAAAGGKTTTKAESGLVIDAASLHNQKLEFASTLAHELLDAAVDVPRFGYHRVPALVLAVQLGQDTIALALLAAGVSADAKHSLDGTTPLMLALLTKNKPVTLALLDAGACVDAMTQDGRDISVWGCALAAPVREDLFTLVSRIHSSTVASPSILPLDALIALDAEESAPDPELFETLLSRGLDVNVSNADGDFVLHALLSQCVVRKRLRGLDVCFRFCSNRHIASSVLLHLITIVVERQGAALDAVNRVGHTPLHAALLHGHTDAAMYLLTKGANPNVRDSFGFLPLHYACLGFFDSADQAQCVIEALLAAATKHAIVDGVHVDKRKYKTPLEKQAVDIEEMLDHGFVNVTAPPPLARTLATVDDVLNCISQPPDGFVPWHLACGAVSQYNASALCLIDGMHSAFATNGAIRASILTLLSEKYKVSLAARTTKQLTGLHLAVKTDVDGSNASVIDVLLKSPALSSILNAVHEPTTIDALVPIEERALVEVTTNTLLYVPHAHVSARSWTHTYHVLLPDGSHLEHVPRSQLTRTNATSSRYTLRMESAFSALHYAVQHSDDLACRLLELPNISIQPDGCDLPLLALACAARRSPDVIARLVTPQVNVRVHLPLHDGTSHDQVVDEVSTSGNRAASRKQAAALHFAVIYEDVAMVRAIVAPKDHANVNVRRSGDGFTPLHLACGMGDLEIIKALLDSGANLIQLSTVSSSSSGVTPLHLLIKNDGMTNDKLKELIREGYVTREMLLEGLGAPATGGGTDEGEIEISCVLLDEEEHNLSLYNHVVQLLQTKRGASGFAVRLQSELTKSDEVLALFFRLISGGPQVAGSNGRGSSLSNVVEDDAEAVVPQDEASILEARHHFAQLKHWHECYAQQAVRSQWKDETGSSMDVVLRRSSFDRRSTRELLALGEESNHH